MRKTVDSSGQTVSYRVGGGAASAGSWGRLSWWQICPGGRTLGEGAAECERAHKTPPSPGSADIWPHHENAASSAPNWTDRRKRMDKGHDLQGHIWLCIYNNNHNLNDCPLRVSKSGIFFWKLKISNPDSLSGTAAVKHNDLWLFQSSAQNKFLHVCFFSLWEQRWCPKCPKVKRTECYLFHPLGNCPDPPSLPPSLAVFSSLSLWPESENVLTRQKQDLYASHQIVNRDWTAWVQCDIRLNLQNKNSFMCSYLRQKPLIVKSPADLQIWDIKLDSR